MKISIKLQYNSLQECKLEEEDETITLTELLGYKLNHLHRKLGEKIMAITSAVCNSFKTEVLKQFTILQHQLEHDFKLALYTSSATLGASTTAYSDTNEITNTSGSAYTAGGKALTSVTPVLDSSTACCDFADVSLGHQLLLQLTVV